MNSPFLRFTFIIFLTLSMLQCEIERSQKPRTSPEQVPIESEKKTSPESTKKSEQKALTIEINNLRSTDAPVDVKVYGDNDYFLKAEGRLKKYRFTPNAESLTVRITDLDYSEYAIAVFQDENNNGKMDKNMLGLPIEGWCLSNNFQPTLMAPTYEDCKFEFNEKTNVLILEMIW